MSKSGAARGLTGVRSASSKRSIVNLTDDLLYRTGVHGKDKGEFNNPQVRSVISFGDKLGSVLEFYKYR